MVFMKDSQRAADLASSAGLATGLHLNLTHAFDAPYLPSRVRDCHASVARYYGSSKWAKIIYNPFLKKKLAYLFASQYDEYCHLFSKAPENINGHHHMHLCTNALIDRIIPFGSCVRRNFSFEPGERGFVNRSYRRIVDGWLRRHYCCTDYFYSLEKAFNSGKLGKIIDLAGSANVEVMVHPEIKESFDFLNGNTYRNLIAQITLGTYRMIAFSRQCEILHK
jgi:hypothetical protein